MTRYQATRIDTTYSVTPGQANAMIPAATPTTPPTISSQRQAWTWLATTSWVMPPNRKATPTNTATTARLPTR